MRAILIGLASLAAAAAAAAQPYTPVFEEMVATVRAEFFDAAAAEAWADAARADADLRARVEACRSDAEWGRTARGALARLGASHTTLYTPADRRYYELLDIFFQDDPPAAAADRIPRGVIEYEGIALAAEVIDGRTFARDVYPGGPAARAGIVRGDELVSVDGGPWSEVRAFRGKAGQTAAVGVRRRAGGDVEPVEVDVEWVRPREAFLRSIEAGSRVIEADGVRVAHVPVLSYAGEHYHEAVKAALAAEPLASCGALVLDLRGGWGGASPAYLDLFNPITPTIEFTPRGGEPQSFRPGWGKPAALLVDGQTRSGKEILAHAFRKHAVGPVVGERTAGAVLAGSVRVLADGSALYVAVGEVRVDGAVLEGAGVEPDARVVNPLPYAGGDDLALERAARIIAAEARAEPGG